MRDLLLLVTPFGARVGHVDTDVGQIADLARNVFRSDPIRNGERNRSLACALLDFVESLGRDGQRVASTSGLKPTLFRAIPVHDVKRELVIELVAQQHEKRNGSEATHDKINVAALEAFRSLPQRLLDVGDTVHNQLRLVQFAVHEVIPQINVPPVSPSK